MPRPVMPAPQRVLWIGATLLIVLQIAVRGYVLARGNFYWDDVAFAGRASRPLTDLGAWFVDYDGHFMPGALFTAALITTIAPLSWPVAATSLLLLQLVASLVTLRTFVIVAGRRPAVLLPLAFVLFTPLTLPAMAWWASGLNALPLQIGLALVVGETLRYLRGSRRSAGYAVLALLGTLLFFEKALVIPFVALAAACLLRYVRGHRFPATTVLHRGWALWLAFLAVVFAWGVLWVSVTSERPGTHTLAFTVRGVWRAVTAGLAPSAAGGPWSWVRSNPGPPLAVTDVAVTVTGFVVLAAVLLAAWRRSPRGLAVWGAAAAYFLGASAMVFYLRSSELTSPLLPLSLRYFADAAWVLGLAGAIVVRREIRGFRPRVSSERRVTQKSADLTRLALVLALVLSASVSTVRFAPVWQDNPTGAYLQNLRAGAAAYAGREVLDQEVYGDVLSRLSSPYNRLSRVLATQPARPRFSEYAGEATVVDPSGTFQPGRVTRVRTLPVGPFPCGTRIDDGDPTRLELSGPIAFWDWVVELHYLAADDGVLVVQQERAATPVRVPVQRGAHTVFVRVAGAGDAMIARAETPGLVVCAGSGPVGLLVPASLPDPPVNPAPR